MNWQVFDLTRSFGKFRVAWHPTPRSAAAGFGRRCRRRWRGRRGKLLDERQQGDAERFADGPGTSRRLGTQHEALVVLIDRDFLDPVEIAHHIGPFEFEAGGGEAL